MIVDKKTVQAVARRAKKMAHKKYEEGQTVSPFDSRKQGEIVGYLSAIEELMEFMAHEMLHIKKED